MRQLFLAFFIITAGLMSSTQVKGNDELRGTLRAIGGTVLIGGFGLKALSSIVHQTFLKQVLDIGAGLGIYTGAFMAVVYLATEKN